MKIGIRGSRRIGAGAGAALAVAWLVFPMGVVAGESLPRLVLSDAAVDQPATLRSAARPESLASAQPAGANRLARRAGASPLFAQNFDADCSQVPPAPPPSPPPPYATPLGFTVHDVDARTPAAPVGYVTNAWIVREDFKFNVNNCAMFSTSWYSSIGAADDWAVFPTQAAGPITPSERTRLSWNAVVYDPAFPDGYEVRYSTAGTAVSDFLSNPALASIAAENSAWTSRSLDLGDLAGTPIHLAFRNNSYDKFLLLIDDILVEDVVQFDPVLDALIEEPTGGYARLPGSLGYTFSLSAKVRNGGSDAITDVTADADLLVDGVPVATLSSAPVALAAGTEQQVALGGMEYAQLGQWTAEALVTAAEGDDDAGNSVATRVLAEITEDELTRAQGPVAGTLGIGAGNGGELGQDFFVPVTAKLTGVRYTVNNPDNLPQGQTPGDGIGDLNGVQMQATIRAWDPLLNKPGDLLYTASVTVPGDAAIGPLPLELPVPDLLLPPGRYLIAAVEPTEPVPQTLELHAAMERFTLGTGWVNWPTSPMGGWANLEDFGAGFKRSFVLSAILQRAVLVPVARDDAFSVVQGTTLTGSVADNDTPSDNGGNTWSVSVAPGSGSLAMGADGYFSFTPEGAGSVAFEYALCDVDGDCSSATAQIEVLALEIFDDSFEAP